MSTGFYTGHIGRQPVCPQIYKVGWEHNHLIQYAYELSKCNLNFVALLEAENDQWTVDRVGITGDIGLCQISPYYHPWITSHEKFYDPYWQLDACLALYNKGERFYGADNIHNTITRFYIK